MKVKILVCMVGADFVWRPGDEVVVDDSAEAARIISAGFAVPVADVPEVAVVKEPEKRGKGK